MKQDIQKRLGIFARPRVSLLLAVVVLLAVLAAYVGITRGLAAQPQPTSVHIVRIRSNEPNFPIVPLDRTITDTSQVQHLYQTILSLPVSCDCANCVSDPEAYVLTFTLNNRVILMVQAHTGMCWDVNLDRGNPQDTREFRYRQATPAFWSELSHVLGIPQSALVPTPS